MWYPFCHSSIYFLTKLIETQLTVRSIRDSEDCNSAISELFRFKVTEMEMSSTELDDHF